MSSDSTQQPNSDLTPTEQELGMDAHITETGLSQRRCVGHRGSAARDASTCASRSSGCAAGTGAASGGRAMASVDRVCWSRRLRTVERQHVGGRQSPTAFATERTRRPWAPRLTRARCRPRHCRWRFLRHCRCVHLPQGDGPPAELPPARQSPDHWRRSEAQRIRRARSAPDRAAGLERR